MLTYREIREACAAAAHEMNRLYCLAQGDMSQPHWDEAPEWQQRSALKGVDGVFAGNDPAQSHASWLAEKAATGWTYGAVKDVEQKTHPCCVPYAELPPAQRQKDHLFIATVTAMAQALGGVPVA